jgi:hypothetical protein
MDTLKHCAADEHGMQLLEWVGISALLLIMIGGIWSAFYGMPGQALKEVMQVQVFRYADGFEEDISTMGPAGSVPTMGQRAPMPRATRPAGTGAPPTRNLTGPLLGVPHLLP